MFLNNFYFLFILFIYLVFIMCMLPRQSFDGMLYFQMIYCFLFMSKSLQNNSKALYLYFLHKFYNFLSHFSIHLTLFWQILFDFRTHRHCVAFRHTERQSYHLCADVLDLRKNYYQGVWGPKFRFFDFL